MNKEYHRWYSERVEMEMPIVVYGHYGLPLLLFPTASADCEEYERFYLIQALSELIDGGRIKVFSIDSINRYTWGNSDVHPGHKSYLTQKYDEYIIEEVVPFIHAHCGGRQPIITSGASMGAFFAANTFFRHPDFIEGMIGMHGVYDLSMYHGKYYDDFCYLNNPVAFLPNLDDGYYLPLLRSREHIYIVTSYGMWENPEYSKQLSEVLNATGIRHHLDIWEPKWPHDWPSWRHMLPKYMDSVAASYGL